MTPSSPARKRIARAILAKFETPTPDDMSRAHKVALDIFFELSLEYDSLRDFKNLCILIPQICLSTQTSLYLRDRQGLLRLHRTSLTLGPKHFVFTDSVCATCPEPIDREEDTAFPLCEKQGQEDVVVGVFCVHKPLSALERLFYLQYAHRIAKLFSIKQTVVRNRQHLAFINNLVRDIGHNVIVPNMHFKLLFIRMEKQLALLQGRTRELVPGKSEAADQVVRRDIITLVKDLEEQLAGITKRFQQSSLFLESLLRRSHFEKGHYDLVLKPCKFKSQIIEPQIDRFRSLLLEHGVTIQVAPDVRIDEDIILDADLGLICQVFANLLSNAVKYTQTVTTHAGHTAKQLIYGWETMPEAFGPNRPGVRLFVSTTGSPVPPKDAVRLFEANFRADEFSDAEGTGHGLYFVKQIVELHGGNVGYTHGNALNTFQITLPYAGPRIQENASCRKPF